MKNAHIGVISLVMQTERRLRLRATRERIYNRGDKDSLYRQKLKDVNDELGECLERYDELVKSLGV